MLVSDDFALFIYFKARFLNSEVKIQIQVQMQVQDQTQVQINKKISIKF